MQNCEEQIYFCNLCSKQAFFMCSNCQEVAYCKPDHQKADWASHKSKCVSPAEKQRIYENQRLNYRKKILMKLARKQYAQCELLGSQHKKMQMQLLRQFPTNQNQLQYGATVVFQVRIMIILKDYNQAQEILNTYINDKSKFIEDIEGIPSKLDNQDPQYQMKRTFVMGKLRLISAIANLTHQLVRNSIQIVQILIRHVQKFYGSNSIQLSNCYFETGLYFHFMNQANKSAACFLKAGKLRKQQGGTCYYNAALTMADFGQWWKALQFFQLALKTVMDNQNINGALTPIELKANIFQNLGIYNCKIENFDQGVHLLQNAMCLLENANQRSYQKKVKNIKKILEAVKTIKNDEIEDAKNYKPNELPHQKAKSSNYAYISGNDFQLFWNGEKAPQKQQKQEEWIASFKQFRKKIQITNIGIKPPQVVEKYLQVERQPQYLEQERRNSKPFDKKESKAKTGQKLKISFEFMKQLSSIQVDYLNQLNSFIADNKDKSALSQFVQRSNFIKSLNKNQLNMLQTLNPEIVKPKKQRRRIGEAIKTKNKTPRLNLAQLNRK